MLPTLLERRVQPGVGAVVVVDDLRLSERPRGCREDGPDLGRPLDPLRRDGLRVHRELGHRLQQHALLVGSKAETRMIGGK